MILPEWLQRRMQQNQQRQNPEEDTVTRVRREQAERRAAEKKAREQQMEAFHQEQEAEMAAKTPRFQVIDDNGNSIRDGNGQPLTFKSRVYAQRIAETLNQPRAMNNSDRTYSVKNLNVWHRHGGK